MLFRGFVTMNWPLVFWLLFNQSLFNVHFFRLFVHVFALQLLLIVIFRWRYTSFKTHADSKKTRRTCKLNWSVVCTFDKCITYCERGSIKCNKTRLKAVGEVNWNWQMIVRLRSAFLSSTLAGRFFLFYSITLVATSRPLSAFVILWFNFKFMLVSLTLYPTCLQNKHWIITERNEGVAFFIIITSCVSTLVDDKWGMP